MTTVTRYVGTCPVCEGEYKLHRLKMVHHGYTRPGTGEIEGDCPGVGWPPFEISPDGAIHYLDNGLVPRLEKLTASLLSLKSGHVNELRKKDGYEGSFRNRVPKFKLLTRSDGYEFEQELRIRIRETERQVEWVSKDVTRLERKIEGWVEGPVRTEDEVQQVRQRMTDERRSVIEVARQAKRDKRTALDAKQAAREQEQIDLIQEYRDIFNRLAFLANDIGEKDSHGVLKEAKNHWVQMYKRKDKKSYLHFYPHRLEIPEALVQLKLAVLDTPDADASNPRSYIYANDSGWEPQPYRR